MKKENHFDHMQDEPMFDVAIVGYGPVGQALALKLARQGHRLLVIERWAKLFGLPRAVGLDHEAMRIIQSLGISEEFTPYTVPGEVYEWRNGDNEVLVAFPGLDAVGESGWPVANGFSQPALERTLDAHVRGSHGNAPVEILQGVNVQGVTQLDDHAELRLFDTRTGDVRTATARYVVGCDGAGSIVRQAMGAVYDDLAFAADWLVVDLRPLDPGLCTNELIQVCDPQRPTTMVTGGPGRRRFEFMLLGNECKDDYHNNPEAAWRLLQRWGWNPANAELERHAVYTFRAAIADRWRQSRLMLAGDAAHLTPPFAAQGLCAGLRDVAALAWRLDMVLRGTAADTLLDTYSQERRAHARVLVDFAVELGRIICVLDRDAAHARDLQLREQASQLRQQKMPAPRLGSSLLLRENDPHSGHLGRQGLTKIGTSFGRFDDLVGGQGFVLIGDGFDPAEALAPEQRSFLQKIGAATVGIGPGCRMQDASGVYRQWFADLGTNSVLVRPDFYIYGAGEPAEIVYDLEAAWNRLSVARATVVAA